MRTWRIGLGRGKDGLFLPTAKLIGGAAEDPFEDRVQAFGIIGGGSDTLIEKVFSLTQLPGAHVDIKVHELAESGKVLVSDRVRTNVEDRRQRAHAADLIIQFLQTICIKCHRTLAPRWLG